MRLCHPIMHNIIVLTLTACFASVSSAEHSPRAAYHHHHTPTSVTHPANASTTFPPYPYLPASPFSLFNVTPYLQPRYPQDYSVAGPPLELVHELHGDFPTGVAVDTSLRLFFNLPRSSGPTNATVVVATSFNTEAPWPNAAIQNCAPAQNASTCFVNVQSVVIDSSQTSLWVVDTGTPPGASTSVPYGAKLWAFDLATGASRANYPISPALAAGGLSINDARFNLSLGTAGTAFLSDIQGSLLVLDLASGVYTRRLLGANVTAPDPLFVGSYDGAPFYGWNGTTRSHIKTGADGIALQAGNLYFAPLASRRLYQVAQTILANASLTDAEILAAVEPIGQIGSYSQGFSADDAGRVYIGTAEQSSVSYFNTSLSTLTNETTLNGLRTGMQGTIPADDVTIAPFVRSAEIQWADSMAVQAGYLWFTTNQLPLSKSYQRNNVDRRVRPFKIYRAYTGSGLI